MSGSIKVEGGTLIFEIHGIDEILSFRRRIEVSLEHVISVSTENPGWRFGEQLRVMGASIPGVIKDGNYLTGDGVMFFEMHHPERCITVNLQNETYKSILFEVDDKESAANLIRGAIGTGAASPTSTQP